MNARGNGLSVDEQMAGVGEGQGNRTEGFSQDTSTWPASSVTR